MKTIPSISKRPLANTVRAGASQFVSTFDTGTLGDMGDRSLDLETHAYVRPRRRQVGNAQNVVRGSRLPFPEPRLPEIGFTGVSVPAVIQDNNAESELRQVEENAGLGFIRRLDRSTNAREASVAQSGGTPDVARSQGITTVGAPAFQSPALRRAYAAQGFVLGPTARETFVATLPEFDPDRAATIARKALKASLPKANELEVPSQVAPRFASLEENIARISQHKAARIAVLAIGVSEQAISKVERLAEVLRQRHLRKVRVLAAEHLDGLRLAPSLIGNVAGEVCLVACQAGTPRKMLPFLSQFDAVILMVEIGETPVDEAADWADTIRRFEIPIVGVWAA